MNILYGVVGEGMGHATRSEGIIRHLLARGHKLVIIASGKAYPYLQQSFAETPQAAVDEISGMFMKYKDNRVQQWGTVLAHLAKLPGMAVMNFNEVKRLDALNALPEKHFDAVVTDFESLTHLYGKLNKLPIINIDNMSIIPRCDHRDVVIPPHYGFDRLVADTITRAKVRDSDHYLITTFFFPPVKEKYRANTFLLPPILRDEIYAMGTKLRAGEITVKDHILVYQTSDSFVSLLEILDRSEREFVIYGFDPDKYSARFPNLSFKGRNREGFFNDLAAAAAIITGGGFSLMSEAVHLGKPVLSIPVEKQFEQVLNGIYLEHLGYGMHVESRMLKKDPEKFRLRLQGFLTNLDRYRQRLNEYHQQHGVTDNGAVHNQLDELLENINQGKTE